MKSKPATELAANIKLPIYRGEKWIRKGLPREAISWEYGKRQSLGKDRSNHTALVESLQISLQRAAWKWPKRPIFFVADPHADAEAFVASLVATGGIKKTGPAARDFKLTKEGRAALFIIGGDCLDKGPSNLKLLDAVRALMDCGAKVKLLAGNHDLRLFLGIRILERERDTRYEHFFVRMGPKIVPFLKEIHENYLQDKNSLKGIPNERECRRRLFPSKRWFKEFPKLATWVMSDDGVERELARMHFKTRVFETRCKKAGLCMRMVYATALKCKELFLEPEGEFFWFFEQMQLAYQEGSFLFIHAGIDDRGVAMLADKGVGHINRRYRDQLHNDPFEFYYGPLANALRTKYRNVNMPLTHQGVERLHKAGIHGIVHGHRNRTKGQRIMLRHGLVHIESDITMDRNTRDREGLDGYGAGATIIRPEGQVLGVSTDFPRIKVFDPHAFLEKYAV